MGHSKKRRFVTVLALIGLLLLFGWVGERDYQDALTAERYRPGPSVQSLAAVNLDCPDSLVQVGSQPQHGVHAAEAGFAGVDRCAGLDRRVSPSWPSGPFSPEVGR